MVLNFLLFKLLLLNMPGRGMTLDKILRSPHDKDVQLHSIVTLTQCHSIVAYRL